MYKQDIIIWLKIVKARQFLSRQTGLHEARWLSCHEVINGIGGNLQAVLLLAICPAVILVICSGFLK